MRRGRRKMAVASRTLLALALLFILGACDFVDTGAGYGDRFFVYVIGSDADGVGVPALVLECVTSGDAEVVAHDPLLAVTIPGTSYTRLREAYPFGGGMAVTQALVATSDVDKAPFAIVSSAEIADVTGAVTVELEGAYNTYLAGRLYSFGPGSTTVRGTAVGALLDSLDFMDAPDRAAVSEAVGRAFSAGLATRDEAASALFRRGLIDTDLSEKGTEGLIDALGALSAAPEFVPAR